MSKWKNIILHELNANFDMMSKSNLASTEDLRKNRTVNHKKELANAGLTDDNESNETAEQFIERLMIGVKKPLEDLANNCDFHLKQVENQYFNTAAIDRRSLIAAKAAYDAMVREKRQREYEINLVLANKIFRDKFNLKKDDYETGWDAEVDEIGDTINTNLDDKRYTSIMKEIPDMIKAKWVNRKGEDYDWENGDKSYFMTRVETEPALRDEFEKFSDINALRDGGENPVAVRKLYKYIEDNGSTPIKLSYPKIAYSFNNRLKNFGF